MREKLYLLAFFTGITLSLTAQQVVEPICGTVGEMDEMVVERLKRNLAIIGQQQLEPRSTQYVPILFHLVGKTDGTGRISEEKVLEQLCILNQDYADMGIQFFLKDGGINYIDNTTVFSDHSKTRNTIMALSEETAALNIFVLQNASATDGGIGVTLGYYDSFYDWVVMRKEELGSSTSTLPHEIGHFFSLPHPHRGWDAVPWDAKTYGGKRAPKIAPGGILTEKQDGSNCQEAGDLICDTPPDYNGFGWPNCNFDALAFDPDSVRINPDENNFMGYFLNCIRREYHFSPMQKKLILADLNSRERTRVRPKNYTPVTTPIFSSPGLVGPLIGESVGNKNIELQWLPIEGAQFYLVEVDNVANFTFRPFRKIVSTTSFIIDSLTAGRTFYWRVKAFNETYGCAPFSETRNLSTPTFERLPNFVEALQVVPNPASPRDVVSFQLSSTRSFEANLQLYHITGQLVKEFGRKRFIEGENRFDLPIDGVTPGVFIISLRSTSGIVNTKLLIQ